jgi:cobalt-zinc-cadmium efflux system outer membrane protein
MRRHLLAITLVLSPSSALAAPLDFNAALEQAVANAPSLRAKSLGVDAARSTVISAGALPDPKIAIGADGFPVSGPTAFSPNRNDFSAVRIGVEQDMPNAAKRHARTGRAQADIVAAQADQLMQAHDVRVATALAWIDLAYAEKRLAAIDELLDSLRPLMRSAPAGVSSGSARPAEALNAVLSLAELDDKRSEIVADVGRARAELTRWTGDPSPDVAGDLPAFEIDPTVLRARLADNPTLRASAARRGQADADVRLARADKRPDWTWDVSYQRRDPRFGDLVSAGVTISLPLFAAHRQDPMIAAKAAEAGKAQAEQEDTSRTLAAELDTALADHVMHHEQWTRATATLLPLAEQQLSLERASYAAGRAALKDILQAHVAVANIRLTTLEREAAVARDAARINLTYGSDYQ